jgi:hypothetical protein
MDEGRTRALEQVLLVALRRCPKTIGFVAPEPGRSSSVCAREVAEIAARAGRVTLLIDLTDPTDLLGPRLSGYFSTGVGSDSSIKRNNEGMEVIPRQERGESEPRYSVYVGIFALSLLDAGRARERLAGFFPQYDLAILNLPPLLDAPIHSINPIAVGAACDQVFLVCQRGRLRRDRFLRATEMARSGGCDLAGIINDESSYTSPGREIAGLARRLAIVSPGLAKTAERYLLASALLN